jgi:monoamine oxidase
VLLGLYVNGGPVASLIDEPIAERVEHVLTHSSKVHPQIRQEFESAYCVWWRNVEYSRGGFATGAPPTRRAQLSKVDNRLLIGSAATAPYSEPDWQEGAVSCLAGADLTARARDARLIPLVRALLAIGAGKAHAAEDAVPFAIGAGREAK